MEGKRMNNKLIPIVLTMVVGIILAGSVLMPVLNSATKTTDKITNTGSYFLTDSDDNYSLVYDPAGKFTVNGEDIPFTDLPGGSSTLVSTAEYQLRFNNYTSSAQGNYAIFLITPSNFTRLANSTIEAPLELVYDSGSLTYGTTTVSYTSDSFRGMVKEGNYVMTASTSPAKVLKNTSIIIGDGTTQVDRWYNRFYIEGTVEDISVAAGESITVSNIVANTVAVTKYVDVVELTSITFDATDGETTVNATYNRVIVPAEITVELSEHLTPGQIALLGAIPVLVIVALLVVAVSTVARRND